MTIAVVEPLPVLLLGCIAGLGFSLSGLVAGARKKRGPRLHAARDRSLGELRAGDIVQHGGTDFSVRRTLQLTAAGAWQTLTELIAGTDPAARALLLVGAGVGAGEAGGGSPETAWLLTALPESRPELLHTPWAPASESLPHDGVRYRLLSRHYTAARPLPAAAAAPASPVASPRSGSPDADAEAALALLCYRGPGARRLVVLRWRAEPSARLYAGELVLVESLIVLAGS